jgi:hypothetical protein
MTDKKGFITFAQVIPVIGSRVSFRVIKAPAPKLRAQDGDVQEHRVQLEEEQPLHDVPDSGKYFYYL